MFRTPHCCSLCSNALQCQCGTFDRRHEDFCDLVSDVCSECREAEADRIPDGPEPDPFADHVKELTLAELDALVLEHAHAIPQPAPARLLQSR